MSRPVSDIARNSDLLVLGYQETLVPDPNHASAMRETDEGRCVRKFPFEDWLSCALRELDLRISTEPRISGGARIDPAALVDALRDRLTGILTQVLAVDPDATKEQIVRDFPALAALLRGAVAEWVNAIAVFQERLHRDASRLAAWLGYARLPELASLKPATSDAHEGGHQALRLVFQEGHSIYYKPRPVTGEWLWNHLVRSVNARSSLRLASAQVLEGAGGRYGWAASLQPHAELHNWDAGSPQASEYWHAAGAMLCVAEHMRMTDLHMANVMATCRGPALFDAESLGTPRTDSRGNWLAPATECGAMIDDLRDTGLLPGPNSGGLPDTSGLFGKAAVVPEVLVPRWSAHSDGSHRLDMVPSTLIDHGNAPPGATPLAVMRLLVDGYREAADGLMRCRESLVSPGAAWRWTLEHAHAPRILLRSTLTYGLLLSRSLQREGLRSMQHRRIALRTALRGAGQPDLPDAVLRTEERTLLNLHIPRFTALPGSRTLAGSSGRALTPRFLSCSPGEAVLRKIGDLSPQRLSEIHVPGLLLALLGRRA
jgi:lantibiotic modifying enzyme